MNLQSTRTCFQTLTRAARGLAQSTLLVCATLAFAGSATGAIDVEGSRKVTLTWGAASGPVAGYGVFVSRNGAPFPSVPGKVTLATDQSAKVSGKVGDVLRVRVAAFDDQGNYGPTSSASELIRFVAPSGDQPSVPNGGGSGGGGSGGGGGANTSNGICDGFGDLKGESRVKLMKGAKRRVDETLLVTLCDGRWAAVAGDGTRLSGDYEIMIEGRKYALFLDRAAYQALVGSAVADSEGLAERRAASWFPQHPRIRLKLNKRQTQAKFKVSSVITSSIAGNQTDGSYNLRVRGKIVRD